jgi:hypothetical protein
MACENCRAKKIRCDQARPQCTHCDKRSLSCIYINERQKRRKISESEIENRFRQLESIAELQKTRLMTGRENQDDINTTATASTQGLTHSSTPSRVCGSPEELWRNEDMPDNPYMQAAGDVLGQEALQSGGGHNAQSETDLSTSLLPGQTIFNIIPFGAQTSPNPSIWLRPFDGDEYTGPSSGISLLSTQGLKWTQETLGQAQTLPLSVFEGLRKSLLGHLRLPKCMTDDSWVFSSGKGISSATEVWRYTNAYFDSVQTIFPILDKQRYFRLTTEYLANPVEANPSWTALFHAVLASGCRAALADETTDGFQESGSEAWGFFKNAMAMEAQLMHRRTDLMAVQAFAVMTVFAQGMASPQRLEYTLCSIAARLSQTLGLHQNSPSEWNLTNEEQCERNMTFWIVYCLDKTIALRCGRPCIFDDDDISCDGPRPCGTTDLDCAIVSSEVSTAPSFNFLLGYSELARMCGIVSKRLYSARALGKSCKDLVHVATLLLGNLEVWRQKLPEAVQPRGPSRLSTLRADMTLEQGLSLQFGYLYIICAVHRRFTPLFQNPGESFRFQPPTESLSFMEAARKMILLTKHLDINSYTPAWSVYSSIHISSLTHTYAYTSLNITHAGYSSITQ